MKTNTLKTLLATVILSNLIACSGGEPSEGEIKSAMQRDLEKKIASSGGALKEGDVVINEITKIECTEAEAEIEENTEAELTYKCNIKLDLKSPEIESVITNSAIRLVKSDDGWQMADYQINRPTGG